MKEHRLGFPKIGRDSRIDLRGPSYGARKVVDFRHFQPKSGERITDEPYTLAIYPTTNVLRGGGQTFFRAFINSELGPPEVAPCMARTFGGVSGHWRQTGSEPRPAQIWSQR